MTDTERKTEILAREVMGWNLISPYGLYEDKRYEDRHGSFVCFQDQYNPYTDWTDCMETWVEFRKLIPEFSHKTRCFVHTWFIEAMFSNPRPIEAICDCMIEAKTRKGGE